MTRGIKHAQDLFITQLQGQYLPAKWIDKDGKVQKTMMQFAVRPIQLFEMVYPKEYHNEVCTTFFGPDKTMNMHKKHNLPIAMIRKGLGVNKVDYTPSATKLPASREHIEIVGIGQKDDDPLTFKGEIVKDEDGNEVEGI